MTMFKSVAQKAIRNILSVQERLTRVELMYKHMSASIKDGQREYICMVDVLGGDSNSQLGMQHKKNDDMDVYWCFTCELRTGQFMKSRYFLSFQPTLSGGTLNS
jgi:hypothetical protein